MSLVELTPGARTPAHQKAIRNEVTALLQAGLERHSVESQRLMIALNAIPLAHLTTDGAVAVVYTAWLCERCGNTWDAVRLLDHFAPVLNSSDDKPLMGLLTLRRAIGLILTGNIGRALVELARALPQWQEGMSSGLLAEFWVYTAWAWRAAGLIEPTLQAARLALAIDPRAPQADGHQALAVKSIIEIEQSKGNTEVAIEQGLRFARSLALTPPNNAASAARIAFFYLFLARLLAAAGRLAEVNEVLELAKACVRPDWLGASRTVGLLTAVGASAVGDGEKFEALTEAFLTGPKIEDAMRTIGMRVRADRHQRHASLPEAARRAAAEQQLMRTQKIEQLVTHIQWDIDSGACAQRSAKMSSMRAASWILDNAAAMAGLRYDPSGLRMAVAGNVARQMALAARGLTIDPDLAEVAGRLALIGYLFVPGRLLLGTEQKDAKAALAVSFLAAQGAGELLRAAGDPLLQPIAVATQSLRLRSRSIDRTRISTAPNAPPLARLMAVALAASEACIAEKNADVSAAELRRAVSHAARWLDSKMVELFMDVEVEALDRAGRASLQIADCALAHHQLLSALSAQSLQVS